MSAILDLPATPILQDIVPTRWYSRASWPDPHWTTGRDFTMSLLGSWFVPGVSTVLIGARTVPCEGTCRELQAWIEAPRQPMTLPVRVKTGLLVSNPVMFTFT